MLAQWITPHNWIKDTHLNKCFAISRFNSIIRMPHPTHEWISGWMSHCLLLINNNSETGTRFSHLIKSPHYLYWMKRTSLPILCCRASTVFSLIWEVFRRGSKSVCFCKQHFKFNCSTGSVNCLFWLVNCQECIISCPISHATDKQVNLFSSSYASR